VPITVQELVEKFGIHETSNLIHRLATEAPPSLVTLDRYLRDERILSLWAAGGKSISDIAQDVGASYWTVSRIIKRKRN